MGCRTVGAARQTAELKTVYSSCIISRSSEPYLGKVSLIVSSFVKMISKLCI